LSKVVKHLKQFLPLILLVVIFLAIQAYGELTIPSEMAKLVDVGITKSGIETAAPEKIRASELNILAAFIQDEAERTFVLESYAASDDESIFKLNVKNAEDREKTELIMGKAIVFYSQIINIAPQKFEELKPFITSEIALIEASYLLNDKTGMRVLSVSDGETKVVVVRTMAAAYMAASQSQGQEPLTAQYEELLSSTAMLRQAANGFIKQEYEACGIDMEQYPIDYLIGKGGYMLILTLLIMIAVIAVSFLSGRISAGFGKNLRSAAFKKIVSFSSNEFDKFSTASLITRSTNDIQQIQTMFGMILRIIVFAPIMAVGGIFKVLNSGAGMSWIIALSVGIILSVVLFMLFFAVPKFKIIQDFVDKVNLVMRESLSGILVIRAFANQDYQEEKFDKANKDLTNANLFIMRIMAVVMPLMMLILNGSTLLIMWVGATRIDTGAIQIGDLMAFIQYAVQIMFSFLMISMVSVFLPRAMVSAKRIAEVLSMDLSVREPRKPAPFDENKRGVVEFNRVFFKYPNAEDYVLKDISFTANPGETTAFIGSTGSGKSTIVNLIPRFYDVTEGTIRVEGADLRRVRTKDLREKIGYVPQKGVLLSGTIESNIKFADENISEEDMLMAAEIAQAADFIEEKPEHYHEHIAQGGANVSGGQRQRLSIARALAKKPQIYIFDDSFSALDYATDSRLRAAMRDKLKGSTLLIVAQRIGTIKNAEKIIVLDEGEIAGVGTHAELLSSCEVYQQIALSQLSQEELDRDLEGGKQS